MSEKTPPPTEPSPGGPPAGDGSAGGAAPASSPPPAPPVPPLPPLPPLPAAPASTPPAGAHGFPGSPPAVPAHVPAAPYRHPVSPAYGAAVTERPPTASGALGVVALVLAIVAFLVPALVAGIAGYPIGAGVGEQLNMASAEGWDDLSVLSPVRGWILAAEIAFWAGTVLGIWAIAQGIVAIVRAHGRGQGIAALVVAVVAPMVFGVVLYAAALAGIAAGAAGF